MNVARHPGAIVVRILRGEDARPAGVGLVVGPREIVTCAHVVNSALGRDRRTQDKPGGGETIEFDFPLLATREPTSATARVTVWQPPPTTGVAGGDIAGLTIAAARLPEGAARALLAAPEEAATGNVEVFGFPADPPRPQGAWVACRLMHRVGGGLVQIDADTVAALKAQPGFSGSAVWDNTRKGVVGMLSVATEVGGSRDAYAIAADLLAEAWPDVLMAPRLRTRELAEPNLRKFRSWMARGEAVVDLDITPEVAFDVCCRAVQVLDPARFSADAARKTIAARTKSRLTSWGQNVAVSLEALAPAGTRVTVRLTPLAPSTVWNAGRTERELEMLLDALGIAEDANPIA